MSRNHTTNNADSSTQGPKEPQRESRVLHTIRALLAKAESTSYPEEAAALTAKAQELISAHAIDLALIEEQTGRGAVASRILFIPAPYPKEKYMLLGGVAQANNCRAIYGLEDEQFREMAASGELFSRNGNHATLVGYDSDLDAVELLFTSLLVQAVNIMLSHGTQVDAAGRNRTKSFRRSFLSGFAWTVSSRLAEATSAAGAAADDAAPGSVLPVLASRKASVDDAVGERFSKLGKLKTSVSNYDGIAAGNHAGNQADLGQSQVRASPASLRS